MDEITKGVEEVNDKININTEEINCLKKSVQHNDESVKEIESQLDIHSKTLDVNNSNFLELQDHVITNEQEITVLTIIIQDNKLYKEALKKQEGQVADLYVNIEKITSNAFTEKKKLEKKLQALNNKSQNVNASIDDLKSEIKSILLVGYFEWHITNYSDKCLDNIVHSLPFWTLNGYKCRLSAQCFNEKKGAFGIHFYLLVGERDRDLVWPFNLKVTFKCCSVDNVKHEQSLQLDETEVLRRGKPTYESQGQGFGYSDFLLKPDLDKCIIDDSITIKCYIETMRNN